jgi:hypothetical protein
MGVSIQLAVFENIAIVASSRQDRLRQVPISDVFVEPSLVNQTKEISEEPTGDSFEVAVRYFQGIP